MTAQAPTTLLRPAAVRCLLLAGLTLAGAAAAAVSAQARNCDRSGCGFIACGTPVTPVPSTFWGEIQPAEASFTQCTQAGPAF